MKGIGLKEFLWIFNCVAIITFSVYLFWPSSYFAHDKTTTQSVVRRRPSIYKRTSCVNETINEVQKMFSDYDCSSQNWTSFVVPFRRREEHLPLFLEAIKTHQITSNYDIHIVEQDDDSLFNRAKLMNIGAKFAHLKMQQKCADFAKAEEKLCIVFHDIDMLPLNKDMQYHCMQRYV